VIRPAKDVNVVRDLAKRYAEIAAGDIQEERRRLWRMKNSMKSCRPLVLATYGMWNVWCREVFGDHAMECEDPFWRDWERRLKLLLFHDEIGDDFILEPWLDVDASYFRPEGGVWGISQKHVGPGVEGGAFRWEAPIKDLRDLSAMVRPEHRVNEEDTARRAERLRDAVGEIIDVNVNRWPSLYSWNADISTDLARLRGLEQVMIDMIDDPEGLHGLAAFMRDAVLAVHEQAEEAGDFTLTTQRNQAMCYSEEHEDMRPNSKPRPRKDLWYFCAAQEFTLVSPAMHDEFLLQYQLPIMEKYGLTAYGCCEDLTRKIDMLRKVPNLRRIGVTPVADIANCAAQIGTDYVISWRPNPTDMVCGRFDPERVRRIIGHGLRVSKGCHIDITLKDIETVEGEPERLKKWVQIVRDVADEID